MLLCKSNTKESERAMKVYWTPFNADSITQSVQISFIEPTPVYTEILKQREVSAFINCPAFLETCKNTFVIKNYDDINMILDEHIVNTQTM
jgi:hypothetical protein